MSVTMNVETELIYRIDQYTVLANNPIYVTHIATMKRGGECISGTQNILTEASLGLATGWMLLLRTEVGSS